MSPVQLFVYVTETRIVIEFTIKIQIKTQCKPLTPAPLPEYRARGARSKDVGKGERETPMPLSNTPSHNPLKQRAVTRRVGAKPSK
jgi:hypothetical protein